MDNSTYLFKIKERFYNYKTKSLEHLQNCKIGSSEGCNCGLLYDLDRLSFQQAMVLYNSYCDESMTGGKVKQQYNKPDFGIIYNKLKKSTDPSYEEYLSRLEEQKIEFKKLVRTIFGEDFKGCQE